MGDADGLTHETQPEDLGARAWRFRGIVRRDQNRCGITQYYVGLRPGLGSAITCSRSPNLSAVCTC